MNRDVEIEALFSTVLEAFEAMFLSRLNLSEEERESFEEKVFLWFDRFTRRPGNEHVPVDRFKISLLSGACHLAREIQEHKGVRIAALSADPMEVAKKLGLIRSSEERAPNL